MQRVATSSPLSRMTGTAEWNQRLLHGSKGQRKRRWKEEELQLLYRHIHGRIISSISHNKHSRCFTSSHVFTPFSPKPTLRLRLILLPLLLLLQRHNDYHYPSPSSFVAATPRRAVVGMQVSSPPCTSLPPHTPCCCAWRHGTRTTLQTFSPLNNDSHHHHHRQHVEGGGETHSAGGGVYC